ncbi:unnamed protein product [Dibothriocephalus latus]|uniref:Uncharacterized protein n=1 Tax=Dibothriocephalus latus TaxID=60516 RepID=A0A3P7LF01_DIBLA|nr:unnamed protein product [Dibothriocephalus latus]
MYKAKREEHLAHLMKIAQLDDERTMIDLVTRLIIQILKLLKQYRSALLNATLKRPDMAPNDTGAAEGRFAHNYFHFTSLCPSSYSSKVGTVLRPTQRVVVQTIQSTLLLDCL